MQPYDFFIKYKKWILNIFFLFFLLVLFYYFVNYLFPFISPFFIGWLLSLLFHPFVTFLNEKCHISRAIGSLLAILLLLAFLSSVVAGIAIRIHSEAQLFLEQLPQYIENLQIALSHLEQELDKFLLLVPDQLKQFLSFQNTSLLQLLKDIVASNSGVGFRFVSQIPNAFLVTIISLLSSYFITKDREEIYSFISRHLPKELVKNGHLIRRDLAETVWGYVKAQLILMVVTFFICIIGLAVIRSPYALLLSVIISIIDALPVFGSGFILWPGALIHMITGNLSMAVGYMIIYLLVTLIKQLLQPKILSQQIGLPPLLTLISMYIGLKFMGVIGMLIGPLLMVLAKTAYELAEKRQTS